MVSFLRTVTYATLSKKRLLILPKRSPAFRGSPPKAQRTDAHELKGCPVRLTGTEDLRVQKTIDGIYSAFEELLCEKEYKDITVKELCDRARINKKTFYRYYPTLNDLLLELQDGLFEDYMKQTEGLELPDDLEQITRAFFRFTISQGAALERIICAPAYRDLSRTMTSRVMDESTHDRSFDGRRSGAERDVLLTFITESTLAIYRQWVASGKSLSEEEISDMAVKLVCGGVNGFLKRS